MTGEPASGKRLRHVVIVGDGLVAWLAAAALGRMLKMSDVSVRVVSTDGASPGSADATLPLEGLIPALPPDEDAIVAAAAGGFSLGIAYAGWSAPNATWFFPFGSTGAGLGPVPFHHLALRLRAAGQSPRFADYALSALAAQAGRFTRPDRDPGSVLSTLRYGLHLDCARLAGRLRADAIAAGVRRVDGTLEAIESTSDGGVAALAVSGGECIEADLFLDCGNCSGTSAGLAGRSNGSDWRDWSDRLPCDRVVYGTVPARGAPPPYSLAQAHRAGWMRQVPLRDRTFLSCFYRSEALSEDAAHELLRTAAGSAMLSNVSAGTLHLGRRARPWRGNCIALGQAAAGIDPLTASNLQLALLGVDRLLRLLPRETGYRTIAAEYNRQVGSILDHARDFALLHYKLNGRRGEPLWDACREMPLSESLAWKLQLFEARARMPMYDEDPFDEASWISLLCAMGVRPRRYSPSADGFPLTELESHLDRVRNVMLDALRRMPTHGEYLANIGVTDDPIETL